MSYTDEELSNNARLNMVELLLHSAETRVQAATKSLTHGQTKRMLKQIEQAQKSLAQTVTLLGEVDQQEWRESQEAEDFVKTASSRETSQEIMRAIAFFARNKAEAEQLWNGDGFDRICTKLDLWERVTRNGLNDASEFYWGAAGNKWWPLD